MGKSIWVQKIHWEEHAGSWFSELGMIEKKGSEWWYSLADGGDDVGPFLNPSQAAKQACIDARGLFTGKSSNDLTQLLEEPVRRPAVPEPDFSEEGKKRKSELFRLSKNQRRKRARQAACRNLDYIISGGQERDGYRLKKR